MYTLINARTLISINIRTQPYLYEHALKLNQAEKIAMS